MLTSGFYFLKNHDNEFRGVGNFSTGFLSNLNWISTFALSLFAKLVLEIL